MDGRLIYHPHRLPARRPIMPDDRDPQRSFDVKLSLILMAIVAICFVGYRVGHGGPRADQVPCAPGQAEVAVCNEELADEREGNVQLGRDRELEGARVK
jgi:uncharacterized phage infection (PIP) family protein YhgE